MNADTTPETGLAVGTRAVAFASLFGADVYGRVDGHSDGKVILDPEGPVVPPIGVDPSSVRETFGKGDPDGELSEEEGLARSRWDVVSMALSGAVSKLDRAEVDLVSEYINEKPHERTRDR